MQEGQENLKLFIWAGVDRVNSTIGKEEWTLIDGWTLWFGAENRQKKTPNHETVVCRKGVPDIVTYLAGIEVKTGVPNEQVWLQWKTSST